RNSGFFVDLKNQKERKSNGCMRKGARALVLKHPVEPETFLQFRFQLQIKPGRQLLTLTNFGLGC
uniref:Uncharacterized protein n=1 Tax=Oryza brachyantha TaxID=4533 RepID=J3MWG1_ORYBR